MAVEPVFVFDGNQRPRGKRGMSRRKQRWNLQGLRQMLDLFNFAYIQVGLHLKLLPPKLAYLLSRLQVKQKQS